MVLLKVIVSKGFVCMENVKSLSGVSWKWSLIRGTSCIALSWLQEAVLGLTDRFRFYVNGTEVESGILHCTFVICCIGSHSECAI